MRRRVRLGIVGCGTVGSSLARLIQRRFSHLCDLTCLADIDLEKARRLAKKLGRRVAVVSQREMVRRCDLIIEAASARAAVSLARAVLRRGKSILVMSVGGLLHHDEIFKRFRRSRGRLFLPSGAIAGVDGLLAARLGKIKKVTLTTRKPPEALQGAPFILARHINLRKVKKETLLFRGPASKAVKAFPQNINVAALLSLAGIGPRRTRVEIFASPSIKSNIHQVEVEGDFGRFVAVTENRPCPGNPKTSYLATLSPAALLEKVLGSVVVGT